MPRRRMRIRTIRMRIIDMSTDGFTALPHVERVDIIDGCGHALD